jgi:hypothetical protein
MGLFDVCLIIRPNELPQWEAHSEDLDDQDSLKKSRSRDDHNHAPDWRG